MGCGLESWGIGDASDDRCYDSDRGKGWQGISHVRHLSLGAVDSGFNRFSGKIHAKTNTIAIEKFLGGNRHDSEGHKGGFLGFVSICRFHSTRILPVLSFAVRCY